MCSSDLLTAKPVPPVRSRSMSSQTSGAASHGRYFREKDSAWQAHQWKVKKDETFGGQPDESTNTAARHSTQFTTWKSASGRVSTLRVVLETQGGRSTIVLSGTENHPFRPVSFPAVILSSRFSERISVGGATELRSAFIVGDFAPPTRIPGVARPKSTPNRSYLEFTMIPSTLCVQRVSVSENR